MKRNIEEQRKEIKDGKNENKIQDENVENII